MKLIADSGSTKVEWCLVDHGNVVKQIFTSGFNALMLTEEEISQYLDSEIKKRRSNANCVITVDREYDSFRFGREED